MTTFKDLGVDADICDALETAGITTAFPIQEQTIPLALQGQDIIGQAKTGTGKTFGFGLPLIQRIGTDAAPKVQALVIVPTRELAVQVYEDLKLAAANRDVKIAAIYGGKAYAGQIEQLKAGAQIVVGTPGRILDLLNQKMLNLKNISEIVLDEADKMLDLGFLPDIEKLFTELPEQRHTMLFSATMPGSIITLARRFMISPVHIHASSADEGTAQANIEHFVYRVHQLDKDEMVARILQAEGIEKAVIFTRTKRQADVLQKELTSRGFSVAAVHGDMNQDRREKSMAQFKSDKRDILIATDVAARGIDVDSVTHVINYTIPDDAETYLHRVGRTGRAGNTGIAVTFIDWEDMLRWTHINNDLELEIPEPAETYSSSEHLFADLKIPAGVKGRLKSAVAESEKRSSRRGRAESDKTSGGRSRTRTRTRNRKESGDQQPKNDGQLKQDSKPKQDEKAKQEGDPTGERAPRRKRVRRRIKPNEES